MLWCFQAHDGDDRAGYRDRNREEAAGSRQLHEARHQWIVAKGTARRSRDPAPGAVSVGDFRSALPTRHRSVEAESARGRVGRGRLPGKGSNGSSVILPDVNLLIYAINRNSPFHDQAREWWDAAVSAGTVALCWPAVVGFLRLATNRRVVVNPAVGGKGDGHRGHLARTPRRSLCWSRLPRTGASWPDCCEPPRSAGIWPPTPTSRPTPSSTAAPSPPTTPTSDGSRGYAGGIRSGRQEAARDEGGSQSRQGSFARDGGGTRFHRISSKSGASGTTPARAAIENSTRRAASPESPMSRVSAETYILTNCRPSSRSRPRPKRSA